jgi:hypothetical protein
MPLPSQRQVILAHPGRLVVRLGEHGGDSPNRAWAVRSEPARAAPRISAR